MTYFKGGDPHLHHAGFEEALSKTHLGQAHIAGTGPKGRTCRECRFWGLIDAKGQHSPGYYSKSSEAANTLKPAKCLAPMPHKAKRRFPHTAKACLLFEQSDNPYPIAKPEDEK